MSGQKAVAAAALATAAFTAKEAFVAARGPATAAQAPASTRLRGSTSAGSSPSSVLPLATAAVVAAGAFRSQDGLTGSAWGDWANYTASPLRAEPVSAAAAAAAAKAAAAKAGASAGAKTAAATTGIGAGTGKSLSGEGEEVPPEPTFDPANEVGVTEPFGYFDPAGFCKKGDKAGFRNLRAAEIKHGRVAMMAAVGAVVQHYVKFPGFDSVPAGLGAVEVPPGTYGFAALFAVSGLLELGAWTEDPSKEPGNFGDPAGLGQYTLEMRNREINNGRMAMFAAIGIIAANVYTGKDAIEQFGLALFRRMDAKLQPLDMFWCARFFKASETPPSAYPARCLNDPARQELLASDTWGVAGPVGMGSAAHRHAAKRGRAEGQKAVAAAALATAAFTAKEAFVAARGPATAAQAPASTRLRGSTSAGSSPSSVLPLATAAVVAAGAFRSQDGLTGSAWGDWANYTASPLRAEPVSAAAAAAAAKAAAAKAGASAGAKTAAATTGIGAGTGKSLSGEGEEVPPEPTFDPANEVGVTEPFGYFDPAGFCKKGDKAGFRNLRAAEIKHGRVAMMAAVGAVVQHYVKFPGFDSVPAGLGAVEVPPGTYGFAALFAVSGLLELGAWTEDPSKEPGNFGDPAGLGQYTLEMRNREINNGRMAMFAAIGIIAANVYTGKDAIEQFGLALFRRMDAKLQPLDMFWCARFFKASETPPSAYPARRLNDPARQELLASGTWGVAGQKAVAAAALATAAFTAKEAFVAARGPATAAQAPASTRLRGSTSAGSSPSSVLPLATAAVVAAGAFRSQARKF
ncbi:FCPA [Symbiodinium natans]|uniref:FCPA protein n=1 Tax=Symbiodinium natans TaxID=878477 RepID=A0A812M3A7_9DINO|nr:FCPA [Symbiodinium natans]